MNLSRRSVLLSIGGAVAASPVLAFSRISTFDTQLEKVSLPIAEIPRALAGFTIAFATDLHLSANVPYEYLADSLSRLASHRADLVVWGGDYVSVNGSVMSQTATGVMRGTTGEGTYREQGRALASRMDGLLRIRSSAPSVAVRGNHEIWVAPEQLGNAVRASGTELLINRSIHIEHNGLRIEIFGVDDFWNGVPVPPQFSPAAALRILVCHNPEYVELLERAGMVNFHLALCGHTHGGQICLPGGLGALTYNTSSRFTAGLEPLSPAPDQSAVKDSYAYTSRGLGVVEIPMRLNCPPEITVLTVLAA